jgi:MATE family multidrug resistance protein
MTATALAFFLAPRFFVGLYVDADAQANRDVVALAATLLAFAAAFQLFDGVQVSAAGALRGYKDTRRPMLLNFFAYWCVGLPIGAYLGLQTPLGPRGLWIGLVSGLVVASVLLSVRLYRMSRRPLGLRVASQEPKPA